MRPLCGVARNRQGALRLWGCVPEEDRPSLRNNLKFPDPLTCPMTYPLTYGLNALRWTRVIMPGSGNMENDKSQYTTGRTCKAGRATVLQGRSRPKASLPRYTCKTPPECIQADEPLQVISLMPHKRSLQGLEPQKSLGRRHRNLPPACEEPV